MAWAAVGNLKGPTGAKGADGVGVSIKGSATIAVIQAKTGAAGDMWLVTDAGPQKGHGLVSDGKGTGASHWTDVGAIQGPEGPAGAVGPVGPASTTPGPAGDAGSKIFIVTATPSAGTPSGAVAGDIAINSTNGDLFQLS